MDNKDWMGFFYKKEEKELSNKEWINDNVFFACSEEDFEKELKNRGLKCSDVVAVGDSLGFTHRDNREELVRRFGRYDDGGV